MAARTRPTTKKKPATRKAATVDVDARLAALDPALALVPPSFPVAFALADAGKLVAMAKPVASKLAGLPGFDHGLVVGLGAFGKRLEKAEKTWAKARADGHDGASTKTIAAAEALKSDLMASSRFLLRHDASVQTRLDRIAEGTGLEDLADDLRQLAKVVDEFRDVFRADASLPREVATKARKLADEVLVGAHTTSATAALAARNLSFWLVVYSATELRAALRFLFRHDARKLAAIGLAYSAQALHQG